MAATMEPKAAMTEMKAVTLEMKAVTLEMTGTKKTTSLSPPRLPFLPTREGTCVSRVCHCALEALGAGSERNTKNRRSPSHRQ